ncbi:MAG: TadE/TadG family type IV pilus assembly protein [Alphaproteobacteria bacterium]
MKYPGSKVAGLTASALYALARRLPARRSRRALQDDSGTVLVEFAILVPVLMLVLAGIIQFGGMMYSRQMMLYAAREAARTYAVGQNNPQQTHDLALALIDAPGTYTASVSGPLGGFGGGGVTPDVTVTIDVPMAEASIINVLGDIVSGDLQVQVTMFMEAAASGGGGGASGGGGGSGGGVAFNEYLTGGVSLA